MSDRSWRDFFESRSFYEYEIFSQKLPLRYAVRRNYSVDALSFVSRSDDEERRRRRRCSGFYWCCCCKTIALLVVALIVAALIGGLSLYFSNNSASRKDDQPFNATTPGSNWTTTTAWNPFTNKTALPWSTHDTITTSMITTPTSTESKDETTPDEFLPPTPKTSHFTVPSTEVPSSSDKSEVSADTTTVGISKTTSITEATETEETVLVTVSPASQQTSPPPTPTIDETLAVTPALGTVNRTSSVAHTTGSDFVSHALDDEWTTTSSAGNTTSYVRTDPKTNASGYTTGLPSEGMDLSTSLDEETTLETSKEETTTPQPWMSISSTSITDDFTDEEEISTTKPWINVSSSTLSDGFTDDYGSGMSDDA